MMKDGKTKYQILKSDGKIKHLIFIRPRFKRDHKSQKRIQCAINNKDFFKLHCYER